MFLHLCSEVVVCLSAKETFASSYYNGGWAAVPMRWMNGIPTNVHMRPVRFYKGKARKGTMSTDTEGM